MKKIFTAIVWVSLLSFQLTAQTKVGYFDLDYVLPLLPEYKTVEGKMKSYGDQIKAEIEAKGKELDTKAKDYENKVKAGTLSGAMQELKARELQDLERQLNEFQQKAQSDVQNHQNELMSPVLEKIQKTLDEVAQANGFSQVFRSEFCFAANKANNISDLVLKKLGVTPPAPKTN
ncbi:MAG: OmpH family outer membrane protein [Microscillaceae bacterium]|jgi:outer membrane protein|nr:OmpH family outer membrane protein [Microscillaceae bacterium]